MSEIVTIQLGTYSNFVGTHYWNLKHKAIQQQRKSTEPALYNSNNYDFTIPEQEVLFHEEYSLNSLSLVPRVVCVDLEGSLGPYNIPELNNYSTELPPNVKIVNETFQKKYKHQEHPFQIHKNNFNSSLVNSDSNVVNKNYNFDHTVNYFTDYLTFKWSPNKNTYVIPSGSTSIDCYSSVQEQHFYSNTFYDDLFTIGSTSYDDLFEYYRRELEKTDSLMALHFLIDWKSGFSVLGVDSLTWFHEEVSKVPVVIFGNQPPYSINLDNEDKLDSSTAMSPDSVKCSLSEQTLIQTISGVIFLSECHEQDLIQHQSSCIIPCDFSQAKLLGKPNSNHKDAAILNFDKNWYVSSSLSALAFDTISHPYVSKRYPCSSMYELLERQQDSSHALLNLVLSSADIFRNETCQENTFGAHFINMHFHPSNQRIMSNLSMKTYFNLPFISIRGSKSFFEKLVHSGLKTHNGFRNYSFCNFPVSLPVTIPEYLSHKSALEIGSSLLPFSKELNDQQFQNYLNTLTTTLNQGPSSLFFHKYPFEIQTLHNAREYILKYTDTDDRDD